MLIKLEILGEPKAQARHRSFKRGEFIGQYDPSNKDKKDLLRVVVDKAPGKPFDCPIRIDFRFYFSRPKSHYGTGKNSGKLKLNAPSYHTSRPDVDNCIKLVTDALTDVYWRNDSLICDLKAIKLYDERPRTEIYIKTV